MGFTVLFTVIQYDIKRTINVMGRLLYICVHSSEDVPKMSISVRFRAKGEFVIILAQTNSQSSSLIIKYKTLNITINNRNLS